MPSATDPRKTVLLTAQVTTNKKQKYATSLATWTLNGKKIAEAQPYPGRVNALSVKYARRDGWAWRGDRHTNARAGDGGRAV